MLLRYRRCWGWVREVTVGACRRKVRYFYFILFIIILFCSSELLCSYLQNSLKLQGFITISDFKTHLNGFLMAIYGVCKCFTGHHFIIIVLVIFWCVYCRALFCSVLFDLTWTLFPGKTLSAHTQPYLPPCLPAPLHLTWTQFFFPHPALSCSFSSPSPTGLNL